MSITFFMGAGPAVKPVRHFLYPDRMGGVCGRPLPNLPDTSCRGGRLRTPAKLAWYSCRGGPCGRPYFVRTGCTPKGQFITSPG